MKNKYLIFFISVFAYINLFPQEEKNILIEVFTNSHCTVCPPAHSTLNAYNESSQNSEKINYIFYHMRYPYSDDPLYIASMTDSEGRDLFYGPFGATPYAFFDGMIQQNNYLNWGEIIDSKVLVESPFKITLTGSIENENIIINSEIFQSGNNSESNLTFNLVVTENISFTGRNGISFHKNVMRKMITTSGGENFSTNQNESKTIEKSFIKESGWNINELSFIVFIQSNTSKNIFQSEKILYSDFLITSTDTDGKNLPENFILFQNYPNPFNPVTKIKYTIPALINKNSSRGEIVTLKIYDILGNEIATLVNEGQSPGEYEIIFNSNEYNLTSGIYFYKLNAGEFSDTKKFILLK